MYAGRIRHKKDAGASERKQTEGYLQYKHSRIYTRLGGGEARNRLSRELYNKRGFNDGHA